jgi:hypothetical protein
MKKLKADAAYLQIVLVTNVKAQGKLPWASFEAMARLMS